MFHQLLTPVGGSLLGSFLVAAIPVAVVLILLGVARRPAWQASLAGLTVTMLIALLIWKMPMGLALNATMAGSTFALWPVMWIVFNALVLYNIAVASGRFDAFRRWVILHLPDDRRVVLVIIGFCFGALLEGVAGFGTPVAITSALLIALGFPPVQAIVFTVMFNTAPVAFGALGAPVTTLGAVTGLSDTVLGAMIGRQLPFFALLLPFYAIAIYGGWRSVKAIWPLLLVAGGSFAAAQFVTSNYISYELTDVGSALTSLLSSILFLRVWQPARDDEFLVDKQSEVAISEVPLWQGWIPWVVISAVVIVWSTLRFAKFGDIKIEWPGLHDAVFVTLYGKPYAALWDFQPLATGTAILLAGVITAVSVRLGVAAYFKAVRTTWVQIRLAILTVMAIIGMAYLMNYSGLTYTLGLGVASVGIFFPLLSAFLGWVAVFMTGSDTSGNALFGNLQVVAANQLGLHPVLMAATNSSGGVMGKMISPQNIATGCATSGEKGLEGTVLARTFKHSVILALLLGLLVLFQQYVAPGMIPHG
ncbi:L-lactate permease [Novosphingobium sp. BL-52-GroH]|uniref:L-lactate permease n=1 Tax=Novosphingobium sp. BL-52-GroH TaxID=3349877 RepID=UPI0038508953